MNNRSQTLIVKSIRIETLEVPESEVASIALALDSQILKSPLISAYSGWTKINYLPGSVVREYKTDDSVIVLTCGTDIFVSRHFETSVEKIVSGSFTAVSHGISVHLANIAKALGVRQAPPSTQPQRQPLGRQYDVVKVL